jgi:hypothetical protein
VTGIKPLVRGWAKRRSHVSRQDLSLVSYNLAVRPPLCVGKEMHYSLIPGFEVSVRQDYFRFWVRSYELFSEEDRRHVRHPLAVPKQLVKLKTPVRLAFSVVLCFQSFHPHLIIAGVLKERLPTVVALVDA